MKRKKLLVDYLNESFEKHSTQPAIIHGNAIITYGSLSSAVWSYGFYFLKLVNRIEGPFDSHKEPLGLLFDSTYDLIVSILGCIARRIPFIILDPHLPKERFEFMMKDSGIKLCVTDIPSYVAENCTGTTFHLVENLLGNELGSHLFENRSREDFSYMIYTSGSTGKPKGIRHVWGEINDNILFMVEEYKPIPKGNVLQLIPFYSDPSIRQLLWPLATGASLTIVSSNSRSEIDKWVNLMQSSCTTDIFIVPNLLKGFVSFLQRTQNMVHTNIVLQRVFCVGEPLHETTAEALLATFPKVSLYNQYGVSEISGNLTSHRYNGKYDLENKSTSYVAIGKILPHIQYHILNENYASLEKEGDVGVLAVRIDGMLSCYNNGVNTEKFIQLQGKGTLTETYFYTGDQIRIGKGNELFFEGRLDYQVKILGHRVELLEIERVISAYESVEKCAVVQKFISENPVLVAYCTGRGFLDEADIRKCISNFLPYYMMPAQIVILEEFPQLPNGKVDRNLLEKLPLKNSGDKKAFRSHEGIFENGTIKTILEVYTRVLKAGDIDPYSNFFELGGNSLLVFQCSQILSFELGKQIPGMLILKHPVVADLAEEIDLNFEKSISAADITSNATTGVSKDKFPLLPLQLAYLFGGSEKSDNESVPIHDYLEMSFSELNVYLLEDSLNQVIARHDMLRCVILNNEFQSVLESVPKYIIQIHDLSHCNKKEIDSHLEHIRFEMSHQVFDLSKFPCFDIRVTRTKDFDILHLSLDGTFIDASSFAIILKDWSTIYKNPIGNLVTLSFSFPQYIHQLNEIRKDIYESDEKYWVDRIDNFPSGPELPLANGPNSEKAQFKREVKAIPWAKWKIIEELAEQHNLWNSTVLLTAFADIIASFSSSKKFALNLTIDNRIPINDQVCELVGNFTSTNLLEFNQNQEYCIIPFPERARLTQKQLIQDLDHRHFSGVDLQRRLTAKLGKVERPMYPVVFTNLLKIDRDFKNLFDEKYLDTTFHITQTPQVWIDCKVYEDQRGLVIEWDYLDDIFPKGMVQTMHELFIGSIIALSEQELKLFPSQLIPESHSKLIAETNNTHHDFEYCALHQLFFKQTISRANACAVITPERTITYEEMADMVVALSQYLIDNGVQKNQLVGILLEKGYEQVLSTLAILSAGAAYVPLDPQWPKDRILTIIEQCNIATVLTISNVACWKDFDIFNSKKCVEIDIFTEKPLKISSNTFFYAEPNLNDVAYVIFTSGTTGVPKGVAVSHKSAVNTILDMNQRWAIAENDRVLGLSELHFDLSVYDIFGILAVGGCLVLPNSKDKREPAKWIRLMIEHNVTLWNTVPALLQMLTDYLLTNKDENTTEFPLLRWVWLSGDKIPLTLPNTIKGIAKSANVLSLGGATEAAIWSIGYPINNISAHWKTIPYGKPLLNQKFYVLDNNLNLCPIWVKGELFIAGVGLAIGYWGDKSRTNASFIVHPVTGERLYRTGDYGKYMLDGSIEFLGREDEQVKINGYRIELGEVKSALMKHYLVADAHVSIINVKGVAQIGACVLPEDNLVVDGDVEQLYQFKFSQPGLRKNVPFQHTIPLELNTQSKKDYICRKSYRAFQSEEIRLSDMSNLLEEMSTIREKVTSLTRLNLELLGNLLSPLAQLRDSTFQLPKYSYASAGNLYPVQVYLEIGEKSIDGLLSGYYYYDPVKHQLCLIHQRAFPHSTVNMIFVGVYSALEPIYKEFSETLMWLNVGYLLGALPCLIGQEGFNWKSIEFPKDAIELQNDLGLKEDEKVLISLQWSKNGQMLQELVSPIDAHVFVKKCGAKSVDTWSKYENQNTSIIHEVQKHCRVEASGDTAFLFGDCTAGVIFTTRTSDNLRECQISSGYFSHKLMLAATEHNLGFCPVGNMDGIAIGDQISLHALFGGKISQNQLFSENSSQLKVSKEKSTFLVDDVLRFLSSQLPNYMLPNRLAIIEVLPLTTNGKVDQKALEKLLLESHCNSAVAVIKCIESDEIAGFLLNIVRYVLDISDCSLNDNLFRLGGDSISAVKILARLRSRFNRELTIRDILQNADLEKLLCFLKAQLLSDLDLKMNSIEATTTLTNIPLTYSQKRLFFLHQLNPNSCEYNIPVTVKMNGVLDKDALKFAFAHVTNRHSILRTRFYINGEGKPRQEVHEADAVSIPVIQCEKESNVISTVQREMNEAFDFANGFLFKVLLIELGENTTFLVFIQHHIISDGWSMGILAGELSHFYNEYRKGNVEMHLPKLKLQYKDFAIWQSNDKTNNNLNSSLEYWKNRLSGSETLELPTQKPWPKVFTNNGGKTKFIINAELTAKLKEIGMKSETTLYCVLLGITSSLLSRYSGQNDICIGSPVSSRFNPELETLAGFFVNTVVHRISLLKEKMSFAELLQQISTTVIESFLHQHCPFEAVVDFLKIDRDLSRTPLLQVMLTLQNIQSNFDLQMTDIVTEEIDIPTLKTKFELTFIFKENQNSQTIECDLEYYSDVFHQDFIQDLTESFLYHAQCISTKIGEPLNEIPVSEAAENGSLVMLSHDIHNLEYSEDNKSLSDLFREQVALFEDRVALTGEFRSLNYKELDILSDRIASKIVLTSNNNLTTHYIPIFSTNRFNSICLILGVLKSGNAYVVLDCDLPGERIEYILKDCRATILLFDGAGPLNDEQKEKLKCISAECIIGFEDLISKLDNDSCIVPGDIVSDSVCTIVYTSGTTGVPKGVLVTHRSIMRMIVNTNYIRFTPDDTIAQIAPLCFDASNFEIFGALLSGARLVSVDKESVLDTKKFQSIVVNEGITIMLMVTSLFNSKIEVCPDIFRNLRILILGGEEPNATMVQKLFNSEKGQPDIVLNAYGPTENGTITSTQIITKGILEPGFIPIGRPITGTTCYVLDQNRQLAPKWVVGELYIGGIGLAKGYLNRDVETSQKFVTMDSQLGNLLREKMNSKEEITRLYRSGDYVSILANGSLRYHKRVDAQVKIRGHRIELMEVKELVLKIKGVVDVAVMITQSENKADSNLIAFVVLKTSTDAIDLFSEAEKILPKFMVPQQFVTVQKIPLTINGKVDFPKLKLLLQSEKSSNKTQNQAKPKDFIEQWLTDLCTKELQAKNIGMTDNFFRIGGHSLLAITIVHKIQQTWDIRIPMKLFFGSPTIRSLGNIIRSSHSKSVPAPLVLCRDLENRFESFPLLDMQVAYLIGRQISSSLGKTAAHCYFEWKFLQLNINLLEQSLDKLISRHEMLRCIITCDGKQRILSSVPRYKIPMNSTPLTGKTGKEAIKTTRDQMSHQILNLYTFPTFDIRVTRLEGFDIIHISFDGMFMDAMSLDTFFNEWSILYSNTELLLPELDFSFRDYVLWTENLKNTESYESAKKYYDKRVATFPPGPDLPRVRNLECKRKLEFASKVAIIPHSQYQSLQRLGNQYNISPTCILLAAYSNVLMRFSTSKHFAINLTLFRRPPVHEQINKLIGEFTSITLLEILSQAENTTFVELTKRIQDQLHDDLDHQAYPALEFQRSVAKKLDRNIEGMYPVVFTSMLNISRFQKSEIFKKQFIETSHCITQTPQVWIDCKVYDDQQRGLIVEWDCLEGVFPEGLIATMHNLYVSSILSLSQQNLDLHSHQMLPKGHVELIEGVNSTFREFDYCCLHELFFRQVESRKGSMAIITPNRSVTYSELAAMVAHLSNFIKKQGVVKNELIGVLLEKGYHQVVSTLAILASGAAYVPIDPQWPKSRILTIIEMCSIKKVLALSSSETNIDHEISKHCIWVDKLVETPAEEFKPVKSNLDDVAYVIFTSGTTGVPKGVSISHKSAVNTILDMNQRCNITEKDRVLGLSDLHFDLSVYDIFGILAAGGCLVLPNSADKREPSAWVHLMTENKITLWNTVPALLQMLTDYLVYSKECNSTEFTSLRWVWLSGDRIPLTLPNAIKRFAKFTNVLSLGGATEAAIWSISFPITDVSPTWITIPYGTPMLNQKFYVLDCNLNLCPIWVKGQLFIAGLGLAIGYWRDDSRTNASFIVHAVTGERFYKTGDYGMYLPNGCIEFLGREDEQVKVNGYRIELGEIRSALMKHYLVTDAHVSIVNVEEVPHIGVCVLSEDNLSVDDNFEQLFEFKVSQPGLRKNLPILPSILLEPRIQVKQDYICRKSYRSFQSERISLTEISNFVKAISHNEEQAGGTPLTQLNLDLLGRFLSPLAQLRDSTFQLPKYTYASAGNLYPVQVYLEIGENSVEGLASGYYYYDPVKHQVCLIRQCVFSHSKVKLILVGVYSALEPIFKESSDTLMWLNVGYLLGAFPRIIDNQIFNGDCITLPEIAIELHRDLGLLKNDKVLVTFSLSKDGQCIKDLLPPIDTYIFTKNSGANFVDTWLKWDGGNISVVPCSDKTPTIVPSGDAAMLFGDASVGVIFTSPSPTATNTRNMQISCGYWGHQLMLAAKEHNFGFCPVGSVQGVDLGCQTQVHILFGGKISKDQLFVEDASQLKASKDKSNFLADNILHFISSQLPKYMIPHRIHIMETWPLTDNGKIDSRLLNKLLSSKTEIINSSCDLRVTPFNEYEYKLMSLWQEVLKTSVSLNTGFFKSGGSSLNALKLALMINEAFDCKINVAWIFEHQTITEQAKVLLEMKECEHPKRNEYIMFNSKGKKRPIILVHPGRDSAFAYSQIAEELGSDQPVVALEYHNLFTDSGLDTTVETMAERYVKTLLNLNIHSPYILGGWSFGGLVAFEMSRQLHKLGKTVKSILMFDTPFPSKSESATISIPKESDVFELINPPEKHLYNTLDASSKEKYCKTAIAELKAITNYELVSKLEDRSNTHLEIVQYLPTMSDPILYTSWQAHCAHLVIETIPGDHGSILRNSSHRSDLVAKVKEYSSTKLVFVLISSNVQGSEISRLLQGHELIAIVDKSSTDQFKEKLGEQFAKVLEIPEGNIIGHLSELDFESCRDAIEAELVERDMRYNSQSVYIVSSNEGNVYVAAELRNSFSLTNGMRLEKALNFRDKIAMKNCLKNGNIKVPKYLPVEKSLPTSLETYQFFETELKSPFVIKPTNSGGGFGVYKVGDYNEFVQIMSGLDKSLDHEAEEFLDGELYHCDIGLAMHESTPVFAECALYFQAFMGQESKLNNIGSSTAVCSNIAQDIISFCTKAIRVLGAESGIFHSEVFRTKNNELTFLEVGARVPGALIPKMYEKTNKINLHDLDILLQVNEPHPNFNLQKQQFGLWSVFFSHESGFVTLFNEIMGADEGSMNVVRYYNVGDYYDKEKSMYNVVATLDFSCNDFKKVDQSSKFLSNFKIIELQDQ